MNYEQYKIEHAKLMTAMAKASDELRAFCGNTNGMPLSDDIKNTNKYKILKYAYYNASGILQKFNKTYAKKYSKKAILEKRALINENKDIRTF